MLRGFEDFLGRLMAVHVRVEYRPGWDVGRPLAEVLGGAAEVDLARGYTAAGPQRADLSFTVEGASARQTLSRGEGKLFVVGVLLAQASYLAKEGGRLPWLLVDDLASELDAGSRARVLSVLRGLGGQAWITAVSSELVTVPDAEPPRMFHVERGRVLEVI
jgi:DNA replication and repair protein RecF